MLHNPKPNVTNVLPALLAAEELRTLMAFPTSQEH